MTKQARKAYSISFSIAYVRVCEWAREPEIYPRPKPEILDQAEIHAERLGDDHILTVISEIRAYYEKVNSTPTPKRPGSTPEAEAISRQTFKPVVEINVPLHEDRFSGTHYLITSKDEEDERDEIDLMLDRLSRPEL